MQTFRISAEPPVGSVVLDRMGRAWQREGLQTGWTCALAPLTLPWRAVPVATVIYLNDDAATAAGRS